MAPLWSSATGLRWKLSQFNPPTPEEGRCLGPPLLSTLFSDAYRMYTGTLIEDLLLIVAEAEVRARAHTQAHTQARAQARTLTQASSSQNLSPEKSLASLGSPEGKCDCSNRELTAQRVPATVSSEPG